MKTNHIYYANPEVIEQQRIENIRKMSPQQRFENLIAIIELSMLLRNASQKTITNTQDESADCRSVEISGSKQG
ncbi:MAG: hypothetical protein RLZZ312_1530 [Bacteroidota bacterium]|jgi:hypothetical protein